MMTIKTIGPAIMAKAMTVYLKSCHAENSFLGATKEL